MYNQQLYNQQLHNGTMDNKTQFQYAWCLVRSKYAGDIRKGIMLLEDLYENNGESEKRDSLYYLAIGNARIQVYIFYFFLMQVFCQSVGFLIIFFFFRNTPKHCIMCVVFFKLNQVIPRYNILNKSSRKRWKEVRFN